MSMETSRQKAQEQLIELQAAVACDLEFPAHEKELLNAAHRGRSAYRLPSPGSAEAQQSRRCPTNGVPPASGARLSQLQHFLWQVVCFDLLVTPTLTPYRASATGEWGFGALALARSYTRRRRQFPFAKAVGDRWLSRGAGASGLMNNPSYGEARASRTTGPVKQVTKCITVLLCLSAQGSSSGIGSGSNSGGT
jgi:hypothetical protein